jgi:hypothetical protein
LLLVITELTGLNWEWLEIQKRHSIDRQTESGVECWALKWRWPTLIASFLYLDSLRPYSLQFFKTLLLKSSLKPCLKPLSLDSLCPMFVSTYL